MKFCKTDEPIKTARLVIDFSSIFSKMSKNRLQFQEGHKINLNYGKIIDGKYGG
jgi:hypothetical protein